MRNGLQFFFLHLPFVRLYYILKKYQTSEDRVCRNGNRKREILDDFGISKVNSERKIFSYPVE